LPESSDTESKDREGTMTVLAIDIQYPLNKNSEVVAAWFRAVEKNPQPEGLFTTLLDNVVRVDKKGTKVLAAYLINPGKYDAAYTYWVKFMQEYWEIEGFNYEFSTWLTIEEAMGIIEQEAPKR
jgi:hypothetical protein